MNGQAKIDFDKWFFEYYNKDKTSVAMFNHEAMFNCFQEIVKQAYIISWFDSVGIGIDAYTSLINKKLYWSADIICEFDIERESATINLNLEEKTRQEATEKAIEKAVEIYNNLK